MNTPITVTMLVKNAERCLAEVLNALTHFNEVLLLDNGSTDNTLNIAAQYPNVTIHHHPFDGFGNMKNRAAMLAKNDWILNIDSDEIITPELLASIQNADLTQPENIYALNRINHYQRRPITGCGWSPDIIPRLYNRTHTQYNHRAVHEALIIPQGNHPKLLTGNLNHYTYDSIEALIRKMQQYSSLYAEQNAGKKTSSPLAALLHGVWSFIRSYILKSGWKHGADGLTISLTQAAGSYYKYAKLNERNRIIKSQQHIDTPPETH